MKKRQIESDTEMSTETFTDLFLIILFMTTLPTLTALSFKCGIDGEPMGFLLGMLLAIGLVSLVIQTPVQYLTFLWMFGLVGLIGGAWWLRRNH